MGPLLGTLALMGLILFIQIRGQTDTQEKMNTLAMDLHGQVKRLSDQLIDSTRRQAVLEDENERLEREVEQLMQRVQLLEQENAKLKGTV